MEAEFSSQTPKENQLNKVLHVECCLKTHCSIRYEDIRVQVIEFLKRRGLVLDNSKITYFDHKLLSDNVEEIRVSASDAGFELLDLHSCLVTIYIYQLQNDEEFSEVPVGEDVPSYNHLILPSRGLSGLWDSLIYDAGIKTDLLEYMNTTTLFSDKLVDSNLISWNRVLLLHGPPGTGKTSLCKALAQKLSIRLSENFKQFHLVEINSHSLFSKWFSESGKLVFKMFQFIKELTSEEEAFVCILIDEVESLTSSRESAMGGAEPSDAIRVVNALLTQIDQIKKEKNVLILATSNLSEAIDSAFLDRADMKQYIGLPNQTAVYQILKSGIDELIRVEVIISQNHLLDWKDLEVMGLLDDETSRLSHSLYRACEKCIGLSGRSLRKLPFLAHAYHIKKSKTTLEEFLIALEKTIVKEFNSRNLLVQKEKS